MRLWVVGGAGRVQLAILPKWTNHVSGKVSGTIELWGLNQAGNETLLQRAVGLCFNSTEKVYVLLPGHFVDYTVYRTYSQYQLLQLQALAMQYKSREDSSLDRQFSQEETQTTPSIFRWMYCEQWRQI